VVEVSPNDADAWYSIGRAQYSQGDYKGAVDSFRKTLALDSQSVKAENNLGLALAAQNQPEMALDAYRQAITFQDKALTQSEQALLNLGFTADR
jgi:tetratricopeptide (TPR) repeat protein